MSRRLIFLFICAKCNYKRLAQIATPERDRRKFKPLRNACAEKMKISCLKHRWFCAVVVSLLLHSNAMQIRSINGAKQHGQNTTSPRSVLDRINANKKLLSSDSHILKTNVKLSSTNSFTLTVDLTGFPFHAIGLLIMDELYLNFKTQNIAIHSKKDQDLWITDAATKRPLARVALAGKKTGNRAIHLRNILRVWLKDGKSSGVLNIEIKPSTARALQFVSFNPVPYIVGYTISKKLPLPAPITCHAHVMHVPIDDTMLPRTTMICSPLDDVTFPFNASVFDVGRAVRRYMSSRPLPKNSTVLGNPPCCHATGSGSMIFMKGNNTVQVQNATITKCGCRDV